jgi:hypothetical protein
MLFRVVLPSETTSPICEKKEQTIKLKATHFKPKCKKKKKMYLLLYLEEHYK